MRLGRRPATSRNRRTRCGVLKLNDGQFEEGEQTAPESGANSMFAMFEGPGRDMRMFSPPSGPRPWTKIIAAFAAGVACTFLITTFASAPRKASPPDEAAQSESAKMAQRTQPVKEAQPAKSSPAPRSADAAKISPPAESSPRAQASVPPERASNAKEPPAEPASETANAAAATEPSGDPACEQQTWPYVNHGCAGAKTNSGQATRPV